MKAIEYESGFIKKYVFDFFDAMAEAVLYQYKDRIVVCCSVQCGCVVGCTFCGTGSKFVRNLTTEEILDQVNHILESLDISSKRLQVMFMSMGEPFLNYSNLGGGCGQLWHFQNSIK